MVMGQVWSKADFDGLMETGHRGGHGSVLAVTAQNPGPDGLFATPDDVLSPLNTVPLAVSIDATPGPRCDDPLDRVRGFYSLHQGGANFVFGDASVRFVATDIEPAAYRALSTIAGLETTGL